MPKITIGDVWLVPLSAWKWRPLAGQKFAKKKLQPTSRLPLVAAIPPSKCPQCSRVVVPEIESRGLCWNCWVVTQEWDEPAKWNQFSYLEPKVEPEKVSKYTGNETPTPCHLKGTLFECGTETDSRCGNVSSPKDVGSFPSGNVSSQLEGGDLQSLLWNDDDAFEAFMRRRKG